MCGLQESDGAVFCVLGCVLVVSTVFVCEIHEVRTFAPCRGL